MNYEKPTASAIERAEECPASAVITLRVRSTGEYAERGTALHVFVEAVVNKHESPDAALAKVPEEWRATAAGLNWAKLVGDLLPETVRAEVAYAIDLVTGDVHELGVSIGRNYPEVPATWLVGTVDLEGIQAATGLPVSRDLKTGQRVKSADENWQVLFHAYAQHRRTGAATSIGGLAYLDEAGGVYSDDHPFDAFDLADVPLRLLSIVSRLAEAADTYEKTGALTVSSGDWCTYCPGFTSCPAKTALIRNLAPELAAVEDMIVMLSPEAAGVAWQRFKELQAMTKRIDEALKTYVRANPNAVVCPDGKIVKEIPGGRQSIRGERAMALLREYGATNDELESCVGQSEWTSLRAVNPPRPAKTKRTKKQTAAHSQENDHE